MSIIQEIAAYSDELTAIRRDLHANPEIGFEVHRTAKIVAQSLADYGVEVHTGIGGTGVVGVLKKGKGTRSIGLRADMDALPIKEETGVSYASKAPNCMHACGHDGHMTFLLGAARYLAKKGNFDGTVHFIFQPAEEIFGGAKAMMDAGLFDKFPCDSVFAVHNRPGLEVGKFAIRPGAMMAGGASFTIQVEGRGSHGARPEASIDPVLVASHITVALQSIISRNVSPQEAAVVSVTQISGGDAFNVIPRTARLGGTARGFAGETLALIQTNVDRIASSVAAAFGAKANIDFRVLVPPLLNDATATKELIDTAVELTGEANVNTMGPAVMASEDFSFMLQRRPGAFMNVGIAHGKAGQALLHAPNYDFNDEAIPYGSALFARIVERKLTA